MQCRTVKDASLSDGFGGATRFRLTYTPLSRVRPGCGGRLFEDSTTDIGGASSMAMIACYAYTNRRRQTGNLPAVSSKRATVLGNLDRADREPQCGRN